MNKVDEEGVLHIHLTDAGEDVLDVFNRAQTGELEPLAKYIEDGKPLIPEMRLFLVAYLRGELRWRRGPKDTVDDIRLRNQHLRRMREIKKENGIGEHHAIYLLSQEINVNEETLRSQIKKAKREENGPIDIGPAYMGD